MRLGETDRDVSDSPVNGALKQRRRQVAGLWLFFRRRVGDIALRAAQLLSEQGVPPLVKPPRTMKHKPLQPDDSWENDAVWQLLDQAPPASAGARFLDDTVRKARLAGQADAWWKRCFTPLPLAGLAGATAALGFSLFSVTGPSPQPGGMPEIMDSAQAAAIQDIAETETLIAAVDHLDDFSDTELVSLIGF